MNTLKALEVEFIDEAYTKIEIFCCGFVDAACESFDFAKISSKNMER